MKFRLVIDKTKPEEIIATVHDRSTLTEQIEALVLQYSGSDRIVGYAEDDMKMLNINQIECITVLDGKTWAIDHQGNRFRIKQRLYELEPILPSTFIRINKSSLANESYLDRFSVGFGGSVDAVFRCGFREYVSRRCFAEIKRRYEL